ncbi:hypothetical protein QR680_007278 [Steinernema hermaphroditum]|uniref:Uncharacterized protein n=1 Tax=Steinernema hermaphroditum TaxID=289476 RepID=A0AA39HZH9_9BILA|nr:hypothetical protein QR680_007278 [Steinernema hermaphroditum]
MDSDKEKKNAVVKVAFMNCPLNRNVVSELINPMTVPTNETAHSRVCSSCNKRIDSQSTACKTCCQAAVQ